MNITNASSLIRAGTHIYTIDLPDTTISITAAVSMDREIDPFALNEALVGTLQSAQAKASAWGGTTYLRPSDEPFVSDRARYPGCFVMLESANTSRRSRQRLKYGRVILVLQALYTFLYTDERWRETVIAIRENDVCVGTGCVLARPDPRAVGRGPGSSLAVKRSLVSLDKSLEVLSCLNPARIGQ